jgi:hypothetical protein
MSQQEIDNLNRERALDNGNQTTFPIDSSLPFHRGLTKREYMATQIMVGFLSDGNDINSSVKKTIDAVDRLLIELNKK